MDCRKYTDQIPLMAMGETTDAERAAFEQHAATCESCRAEYERLREIVAGLAPDPNDSPTEIETLQMENEILRRLAEESLRESARRRQRAPLRMLVRIAAAIMLLALGYLARPSVAGLMSTPASTARVTESATVREDIRRAMKSGYRFSGQGLAVIARGTEALKEVTPSETGR